MTRGGRRAALPLACSAHACPVEPVASAFSCVCRGLWWAPTFRLRAYAIGFMRQGSMAGDLFRHQKRALAFMLHRERPGVGGPAGGILADDQVRQLFNMEAGVAVL